MRARHPRRFFREAAPTGSGPFGIALDGRPLKTPSKRDFLVPSLALAEAIAAEWNGQGNRVNPERMALTKLANTAIDRVADSEQRIIDDIVGYAGADLVCYRATEPEGLVQREGKAWDPIMDWGAEFFDAEFQTTVGIIHQRQDDAAIQAVRRYLTELDAMRLCAIHNLTTLTGSALIATALTEGLLDADDAWHAAHVDEDWQIERWGRDEEATQRRMRQEEEFRQTVRFLSLLGQNSPNSPV
jgi:chaperone required for assembly of F1-ATPase